MSGLKGMDNLFESNLVDTLGVDGRDENHLLKDKLSNL